MESGQITAKSLTQALQVGGGILQVVDPADGVRRAYRRAIHAARTSGAVPQDMRLHHTGRDRGDLVIRLIPTWDGARRATPAPVPIPDEDVLGLEGSPELLRAAASLRTSADVGPRALRILRALSDEATRRGHGVGMTRRGQMGLSFPHGVQLGGDGAVLAITVGPERFEFDLFEEDDLVDIVPEAELATKR